MTSSVSFMFAFSPCKYLNLTENVDVVCCLVLAVRPWLDCIAVQDSYCLTGSVDICIQTLYISCIISVS